MAKVTCRQCIHEWACIERGRGICRDFAQVYRKDEKDEKRETPASCTTKPAGEKRSESAFSHSNTQGRKPQVLFTDAGGV